MVKLGIIAFNILILLLCFSGCGERTPVSKETTLRYQRDHILSNCLYRAGGSGSNAISGDAVLACGKVAQDFGKE